MWLRSLAKLLTFASHPVKYGSGRLPLGSHWRSEGFVSDRGDKLSGNLTARVAKKALAASLELSIKRRKSGFALEIVCRFSFSPAACHDLPISEDALWEDAMMDRFELMTGNSEEAVNRAVEGQKSLCLGR